MKSDFHFPRRVFLYVICPTAISFLILTFFLLHELSAQVVIPQESAETLEGNKGEEFALPSGETSSQEGSTPCPLTGSTTSEESSSETTTSASPSLGSTGPSGPKVYKENKNRGSVVPKFPGYGGTSSGSPYGPSTPGEGDGTPLTTPKSGGVMVNKGLMDHIRSTPRTATEDGSQPSPTTPKDGAISETPAGCDQCFLVTVESRTSNHEISERANGQHTPWERQFEREAYNKAATMCTEKFKDTCPSALECVDVPRKVETQSVDDIYEGDGAIRTPGVISHIGIHFKCTPQPPKPLVDFSGPDGGAGGGPLPRRQPDLPNSSRIRLGGFSSGKRRAR